MEYLKGVSQAMKQAQADNTSESYGYVATAIGEEQERYPAGH